jgi:hypothetical protein
MTVVLGAVGHLESSAEPYTACWMTARRYNSQPRRNAGGGGIGPHPGRLFEWPARLGYDLAQATVSRCVSAATQMATAIAPTVLAVEHLLEYLAVGITSDWPNAYAAPIGTLGAVRVASRTGLNAQARSVESRTWRLDRSSSRSFLHSG